MLKAVMQEFKDDDEITPLPCHATHYFHTECIEQWLSEKEECPLCREPIDIEANRLSFVDPN